MPNTAHFTIANWCIFIACVLPIVCAGIAKSGMFGRPRREGGYDNADPRGWLARQADWRARANSAQANSFEALPFFIAAVLAAQQMGATQSIIDILAVVFITLRIIYIAMYVADLASARTLVWITAFAVNAGILFFGYR
ncbi:MULTISPECIES: MAPEG family protein [Ramlibacter]|uniref:MAPEG family protein n=1 Tax=Ramlibacter aquaticus TaxID=2780094 RepID=A0ABR9SE69_9BURK|nr:MULTISPECIES: MAPEG family protein [Ramlibacter]MBE7940189.1 MAPEG family protein [Ramlibacter aquaticus]